MYACLDIIFLRLVKNYKKTFILPKSLTNCKFHFIMKNLAWETDIWLGEKAHTKLRTNFLNVPFVEKQLQGFSKCLHFICFPQFVNKFVFFCSCGLIWTYCGCRWFLSFVYWYHSSVWIMHERPAGVRLEFAPLLPKGNQACEGILRRWQIPSGGFWVWRFPNLSALVQWLYWGKKTPTGTKHKGIAHPK